MPLIACSDPPISYPVTKSDLNYMYSNDPTYNIESADFAL